ncbi:PREDICTED: probable inactive serine/threonine-protein kinase slob2 [Bactrocera latifrons]|uniref:probable inactive serine/threonine-protein kinase slob2 n=1 Tax=Bactrocera latifrons TaxID=174628 RepID=UPI0008DD67C8|nr:PREDICTED: probable inactive serine/threonine-protein kinase slob2 [Bactrocera latifrons]
MRSVNAPTLETIRKTFASASSTTTTNSSTITKSNSNSSNATDTIDTTTSATTTSNNVVANVDAAETAPFTTTPPSPPTHSPFFSKLPVSPSFDEMFATSPFKSRIYDEFERFWRSFDHTT